MIEEAGRQTFAYFQVLQAVQHSTDLKAALLEHAHLRDSDTRVAELYRMVGYSPGKQTFLYTPQRDSAMRLLMQKEEENWLGDEQWDVHRGLREEMSRTCMEAGLYELENASSEFMDYTDDVKAVPMAPFWREDLLTSPYTYKVKTESTTPRSSRGLKRLSRRVKEVVQERATSTYKDVADDLIRELEHMDITDKEKEEKNIRRRVYDALNVLIAAGVMGKKGKLVVWRGADMCYQPPTESEERYHHSIQEKRKRLQSLIDQVTTLKALIERNKRKTSTDRVYFPAKLLVSKGNVDCLMTQDGNFSRICVTSTSPIQENDLLNSVSSLRLSKTDCLPEDLKRLIAGSR